MNFIFKVGGRGISIDIKKFPVFMTLPNVLKKLCIDLVLDVGANKGQFIQQVRKNYKGEIIAFEPLKKEFDMLQNKFSSKKVRIYNYALGNFSGPSHIYFSSEISSLASLHQTTDVFHDEWGAINNESSPVNVVKLDDIWNDVVGSDKKVFMKIDTQGSDFSVIEGAECNLENILGIQTELSINPIYKGQKGISETIEYLRDKKFYLHSLCPVVSSSKTGEMLEMDGIFLKSGVYSRK